VSLLKKSILSFSIYRGGHIKDIFGPARLIFNQTTTVLKLFYLKFFDSSCVSKAHFQSNNNGFKIILFEIF